MDYVLVPNTQIKLHVKEHQKHGLLLLDCVQTQLLQISQHVSLVVELGLLLPVIKVIRIVYYLIIPVTVKIMY